MLLKDFQTKLNGLKKGKFYKATWKSEKEINGIKCEKVSSGVVRFVKYANIKGVVVKGTSNGNGTNVVIQDILYQTSNGNLLVQFGTTKIKAKSTYKINGSIVDKNTYETMVKPNNHNSPIFRVKLENLISLG